ncbi:ribonuclease YeeF family protein [Cytobacillus oceanisediminis]|uniref:ribonuclease YeeF family protein n=1 Tax=Cytobacillus oceanisediminis TaxID=665099 RepID=UPI0024940A6D|nr:LXG domain-containing protein [Cytobacillus oceanisediminis]
MSNGRRRFILKVLDARELHSGLKELHSSLYSLEGQIRNIARDVEGITSLEDSFRGEGAAAIQAFFRECHSPFLLFFEGFLADYQNTLKRIATSLQMLEPASNGFIRQSFLDGEAAQGLVKTESITTSLTEETNAVMQKVSDIVSLPHLQDGEFSAHVRRAELHRRKTVDDLITFDGQQTLALDPMEQDLQLMQTYIDEISSLFQSGNLIISGYSVKQLHTSPIYGELLEGIRHKAGNSMSSPEFLKELGETALGQILPPGAFSIWAIWQSTYERKTIHYQLRALKALAELNSNEISPEEFTSLSGREILTVEVIDEYGIGSQNQGGKFHLYDDGRIVREYYAEKGKAYEFVDSIPEDRVGGARELDSIADGTPLEILEYLSLAAVVRKQGTKVIRKSINKADFDALVRILKEEKGHVVLPGKKAGRNRGEVISHPVLDNIRTGSALKEPDGQHGFNDIIDNYTPKAKEFEIVGGDGVRRNLYQIEGGMKYYDIKDVYNKRLRINERITTVKDQNGIFEWIVDPTKGVTHRRFIPNGQITGSPNQRP